MNTKPFFAHDKAIVDSVQIGAGTRVWAFSHVLKGARIGEHCNIGEHVFIENDVVIGNDCTIKNGVAVWDSITLEDGVFVGPYAVFTNDFRPRSFLKRGTTQYRKTILKKGCTIGANATIVCGVTIGEFAMVGAGSVVTKNVPPHTLVVGHPARPLATICFCGERLVAKGTSKNFCEACHLDLAENTLERTIQKHSIPNV